jgi:hypothetical protein
MRGDDLPIEVIDEDEDESAEIGEAGYHGGVSFGARVLWSAWRAYEGDLVLAIPGYPQGG